MYANLSGHLFLAAAVVLTTASAGFAAEADVPIEEARPAIYTNEADTRAGERTTVQPVQYVSTPWGRTWYGANSYAYAPTSYYAAPYYDYYGYAGYDLTPYDDWYAGDGPTLRTSYFGPSVSTYTAYRPYYVSHGAAGYSYGWLPYSYQTRPYGSFYRYYGPVYGSGFHMWFGY